MSKICSSINLKVEGTKMGRPTYRLVKWPDPEDHHCAPLTTKYLVNVHIF